MKGYNSEMSNDDSREAPTVTGGTAPMNKIFSGSNLRVADIMARAERLVEPVSRLAVFRGEQLKSYLSAQRPKAANSDFREAGGRHLVGDVLEIRSMRSRY